MNTNNFALTTLSSNPEYFEDVIKLIEEEFHYSSDNQYEKDFAPLVNPLNFENCYLYIDRESNTLAAHLAVCLRTMIKDEAEIKVALIGGIVTNKKYRGKNLFKNLMDYSLAQYQDKVALFILWSDLENLYEKFNFYRTGGLIETGVRNFSSSERPGGYEKTKFSSLSEKDFEAITNLYKNFNEKYFFTMKRDNKDWSIIREMSSIDLYIKKNSMGSIEKYFCINKGRDLTNIIHEISCLNQNEYTQLISDLETYKIWLPETEESKLSSREIFYTAFIKLGNITLLNKFLAKISSNQLKIDKMENSSIEFSFKNESFTASEKDFLQYLFGPKPLQEFAHFGLSMYIAGCDSI